MAEEQNRITKEILHASVCNEFTVEPGKVEITDFSVSPGAEAGANIATVVKLVDFKYNLEGEEQSHSYIYKEVPYSAFRERFVRGGTIWKTEVAFYHSLAEKMQAIRRSIGQADLPFPKCYYASDAEGVIVLENLKTKGFKTVPKSPKGIPEDRLIKVLKEIAHFHAATYDYLQNYPGGMESLRKDDPNIFIENFHDITGDDKKMREMMVENELNFLKQSAKILEQYSKDKGAELSRLLNAFIDADGVKRTDDAQKPRSNFHVILHGDLWYSNFMFSDNEDGSCNEIMLIDMQMMRIANPSVDLVYLLCSSSDNEARKDHLGRWLKIYHETLIGDLKLLGHSESVYPFEELKKDIDYAYLFGFFLGMFHCQVLQITSKDDFDMDAMTEDNMQEMMDKKEKSFIEKALLNDGLCNRMMGLVMEGKERNII